MNLFYVEREPVAAAQALCDKHSQNDPRDCTDAQYCSQALRDPTSAFCVQGDPQEPPKHKMAQIVSKCVQVGPRAPRGSVLRVFAQVRQDSQDRKGEVAVSKSGP